jgi:hypothetical protein
MPWEDSVEKFKDESTKASAWLKAHLEFFWKERWTMTDKGIRITTVIRVGYEVGKHLGWWP